MAQVFSCEFCEISKNTIFAERLRTTTSVFSRAALSGCIGSKQKPVQSKIFQQGSFARVSSCSFRQVFVHYLILMFYKYSGGYIYQHLATCQEKEMTRKISFYGTTNWIVLVVRWSIKYFFAPNSPIFGKSLDEGRKQIARHSQRVEHSKQMQK